MNTAIQIALGQHYASLATGADQHMGVETYVDQQVFRAAMGTVPTAVSVLTTRHPAGVWGMTVGSLTSLSLDPPLLLVCLHRASTTLELLAAHGRFAVSVLAADQSAVADTFARHRDYMSPDAFSVVDDLPVIPDAVAWLTCRHRHTYTSGDHAIVIGAVQQARHTTAEPLVRHASRYRLLR